MKLVLASASTRRKEILTQFGYNFEVKESNAQELTEGLSPVELAKSNAFIKANSIFTNSLEDVVVLGADTIVVLNKEIIGKPKDQNDAIKILSKLSGKVHQVYTGYAIVSKDKKIISFDKTDVKFNLLDQEKIEKYVKEKNPLDKAGAYGIQDGYGLVDSYFGSLYNVIGLPIEKIKEDLSKF